VTLGCAVDDHAACQFADQILARNDGFDHWTGSGGTPHTGSEMAGWPAPGAQTGLNPWRERALSRHQTAVFAQTMAGKAKTMAGIDEPLYS
jgi:hypothetical protein